MAQGDVVANRYRVVRRLGGGSVGEAFEVVDQALGAARCLKLLSGSFVGAASVLRHEFELLRGLYHPSVVELHDFGLDYLTTSLVRGTTLDHAVAQLSATAVIDIACDVLHGLAYLHSAGLRHGDLKPENVMVAVAADASMARGVLIDLSCADQLSRRSRHLAGTPGYLAPEVLARGRGEETLVDGRADLFAFGVMLGDLARSRADLDRSLVVLAERLTAPAARDRPFDANEVIEALGRDPRARTPRAAHARVLHGRADVLERAIQRLARARAAGRPLLLRFIGPRGAGRSRLLREVKWNAMEHGVVVEGFAAQPNAILSLLERATATPLAGDPLAALVAAEAIAKGSPIVLLVDDVQALSLEQAQLWRTFVRCLPDDAPCIVIETALREEPEPARIERETLALGELEEDAIAAWCDESLGQNHQLDPRMLLNAVGGLPTDLSLALAAAKRGALPTDLAAIVARESLGSPGPETREPTVARLVAIVGLSSAPVETQALLEAAEIDALPDGALREGVLRRTEVGWTSARPVTHEALVRTLGEAVVLDAHRRLADAEEQRADASSTEDPRWGEHLARACEHHARGGALIRARELAHRAAQAIVRAPRPWLTAFETLARINSTDPGVLDQAARACLRAGEPARALVLLRERTDGDDADVVLLTAECELERGQAAACLSILGSLAHPLPRDREAKCAWLEARAHLRLGHNEDALLSARRGLAAVESEHELRRDLSESAGIAALYVGRFDEAQAFLDDASSQPNQDPKKLLRTVSYQAILSFRRGDNARALLGYRRAHEIAESAGIVDQLARTALNLGTALHQEARYADALAYYEKGERLAHALDQRDLLLAFWCNSAKVRADLFDLDAAEAKANRLTNEAESVGARFFVAAALTLRAEVVEGRGDLREAWELRDRAKVALEQLGAHRECLEEEYEQGRLMCARGLTAPARDHLESLSKDRSGAADLDVKRDLLAASIALLENDLARALDLAERASTACEPLAQPALLAATLSALATIAERAGLSSQADAARARLLALWGSMSAGLPGSLRERFYDKPQRKELVARITRAADVVEAPAPKPTPESPEPGNRLATAERLLAVFRKLNSTLDTNDIVAFAVDEAIALTGAERGFLLLGSEGTFRVAIARNMDKSALGDAGVGSELHISRTITDEVIRTETPIITVDALADRRFAKNQSVHALKLRSVLAVPIRSPEGVLGALYLDNRWAHSTFAEGAIDLLLSFGDQVALALRNAEQLDRLRKQTEALTEAHGRLRELASGQAQEIERLEDEVRRQLSSLEKRFDEAGIVGRSSSLRRVLTTLDRVIDSPLSILIGGESGTGKELIARAIHLGSRGRDKPFIAINCGALPATLLESELFGHKKGAFTGADRDRTGLVLAAAGGTLFLDELGEMPLETQVKLLRVLQEREVRAVGSERAVPVDFRLVAATNRNLEEDVARGRFREDLFYRVSVVAVTLPPLRDRQGDLPELAAFFATRAATELGKGATRLSGRALRKLAAYDWPGNIRQLSNVIMRAVVLAEGALIDEDDIELPIAGALTRSVAQNASASSGPTKRTYRTGPIESERDQIEGALQRAGWNVVRAADALGVPRATFYRRMRLYGLARDRSTSKDA